MKDMASLLHSTTIAFIPSSNLQESKLFFESKLALKVNNSDEFAIEIEFNQALLRITKVTDFIPASYTVFGWGVSEIESTVYELALRGIEFESFDGLSQDDLKICTFPGGGKVAWFKDPGGNTLSITQFQN